MTDSPRAQVGVFGGSGFYSLFSDTPHEVTIDTPFGSTSDTFVIGAIGDKKVAFLPRHGRQHSIPPHLINYRANVWAMKSLGVTDIIAPNACGSLQTYVHPGDFVICDQFVDRTTGRRDTFFDGQFALTSPQIIEIDERVTHVSSADPYC